MLGENMTLTARTTIPFVDLAGYDASTGKLKVMVKIANDNNDNPTSLSFGDGVMIVPAGTTLVAIQGS